MSPERVSIQHAGETYNTTEKAGTRIATGELAMEFESIARPGFRVWVTLAGEVYPE